MSKIASEDQETRYILSRLDTLEREIISLKQHFTRKLKPSTRERSRSRSRSKSKSPVVILPLEQIKQDSPESSPDEVVEGPLIKNGYFKGTCSLNSSNWMCYTCPTSWESSKNPLNSPGGPVITLTNQGVWSPKPGPCNTPQILALQPYKNREICYIRQQLTLKKDSHYTLSFFAVSRPDYPKGTLTITIDSKEIFKKKLPETWKKYIINFFSPKRKPMLSFINYGLEANDENIQSSNDPTSYATSIACVILTKSKP